MDAKGRQAPFAGPELEVPPRAATGLPPGEGTRLPRPVGTRTEAPSGWNPRRGPRVTKPDPGAERIQAICPGARLPRTGRGPQSEQPS